MFDAKTITLIYFQKHLNKDDAKISFVIDERKILSLRVRTDIIISRKRLLALRKREKIPL